MGILLTVNGIYNRSYQRKDLSTSRASAQKRQALISQTANGPLYAWYTGSRAMEFYLLWRLRIGGSTDANHNKKLPNH